MKNNLNKIYKKSDDYIKNIKMDLENKIKIHRFLKIFFYSLIFILNITIIILTIVALVEVVKSYNVDKSIDFNSKVLPTIFVSLFSILIFIISLMVSIYENVFKKSLYKEAYGEVLYENMKYQSKENDLTELEFKKKIYGIYNKVTKIKKKSNYKKIIINSLSGDENV